MPLLGSLASDTNVKSRIPHGSLARIVPTTGDVPRKAEKVLPAVRQMKRALIAVEAIVCNRQINMGAIFAIVRDETSRSGITVDHALCGILSGHVKKPTLRKSERAYQINTRERQ